MVGRHFIGQEVRNFRGSICIAKEHIPSLQGPEAGTRNFLRIRHHFVELIYNPLPPLLQSEDPDWSYKKDLAARAAAGGLKPPTAKGGGGEEPDDELQAEAASRINIGDRCEAAGGRRGQVMFVGKVNRAAKSITFCLYANHSGR